MVFDILPITHPEFFPPWAYDSHRGWTTAVTSSADVIVCISEHVKLELALWLERNGTSSTSPTLLASHLGADVAASFPSNGLPGDADDVMRAISSRPTFLMVGTIEPRKGHLQAVEAFERLWRQGMDVNLVIVGYEGWKPLPANERRTIPAITDKIRRSDELGKRLYWLEGISDEYLNHLYKASACLLAPSEGEGYGLPLIEAAQYGIPIIARDIPVFREVAGDSAHYFEGTQPEHLEQAVRSWLELKEREQVPDSGTLQWETWEQSAQRLGRLIVSSLGIAHRLTNTATG
jgi:glycosyltransferase involved in cell wall biosynthesis